MKLVLALVKLHFCFAGFHVVSRVALNVGVSKEGKATPYFSFAGSVLSSGITGNHCKPGIYLLGLYYASPTFASAMQNLVPAITFVAAAALRTGLGDAFTSLATAYHELAPVLKKYPAKLTLTSFTCFFGHIQFLFIAAFVETDFNNWKIQSMEELFTILYAAVVACGIVFSLQTWCIHKGSPVFVAVFQPLQTLLVAIMAFVILGDKLYSGRVIGAVLITVGLYLVQWGKTKEKNVAEDEDTLKKPLLKDPESEVIEDETNNA
ncbi:WAT1-related protein [Hibiscus syriacus]|uniref:WAT1-related protein n=1 Tax=Hibiscus syriacus TaxID=106335 RepID=A0A6A3B3I8_HIBSY|nr:WAT1-related protein [Hibiscus syriacus]